MRKFTQDQLKEILVTHQLWLYGEGGARADLSGASLSGASLSGADLSDADLKAVLIQQ